MKLYEISDEIIKEAQSKYKGFAIYECPEKPTEYGKYIGKTPLYEQAVTTCENAKKQGKSYFIKGIKEDGTEIVIL